jgi:hypothetical protein
MTYTPSNRELVEANYTRLEEQNKALVEALSELENTGQLVLSEINSTHTGWYFQFQAALQRARKALAEGKEV